MSAALAGLGGGFLALALGQVDPDSMVNWTVSGELGFVSILSGAGGVAAPFVGSMIYELIRTYAFEWLPLARQLIVGSSEERRVGQQCVRTCSSRLNASH